MDMAKAYDRVECSFLEGMMRKLVFNEDWTAKIMNYVKRASFSILLNEAPKGKILPERRLRQGWPCRHIYS